ncbi:MAG: penicillin acylase family protein [Candidatus Methylomirabilales bacterium]
MIVTDRYLRLLILFGARLLSSVFPQMPGRLGLKRSGRQPVVGIEGPVTIRRDHLGIPTIQAQAALDLFFGFGYAITQDRLWQMDLYRRVATGRMAEILGDRPLPAMRGACLEPSSIVDLDCLHRALGFSRVAHASLEVLSHEARASLDRYAAGVNVAVAAMQEQKCLPVEFYLLGYEPEPWTPRDSLAVGRFIAWMLCLAARAELVLGALASGPDLSSLLPVYPKGEPVILHEGGFLGGGWGGSNSWVVGPGRTRSGHPLLCNDPHLSMGLPCLFYQVALQGAGYHVTGAAMPGIPAVVIGTNADIAWGITSAVPDDADVYLETLHPSDPQLYAVEGEWRRFKMGVEEIAVRGEPSRRRTLRYIPRGGADCPLLSDILPLDNPLSLRWTGLEPSREMDAVLNIGRARGPEQFREALRDFALPAQNFLYADRQGNYAYFCAGRFPQRPRGGGPFPLNGAAASSEWQGDISFDELPFMINPPSGLIVTANHRIVDDTYPHELTYLWEPPYRARRILELLNHGGLDVPDMTAIQGDVLSLQAKALVTQVVAPVAGELSGKARRAAEQLLQWDFRMEAQSPEAALFHSFYERLRSLVFADRLNEVAPDLYRGYFSLMHLSVMPVDRILERGDPRWMPDGRGPVVGRALEEAVALLEGKLGTEGEWAWGKLHTFTLRHPLGGGRGWGSRVFNTLLQLNREPFPHPGDGMTVNVAAYFLSHPFEPVVGPAYRQIVDLGNLNRSLWIIPGGSSGDPFSRHYSDQLEDWRHARNQPMFQNATAVSTVLELVPNGRESF